MGNTIFAFLYAGYRGGEIAWFLEDFKKCLLILVVLFTCYNEMRRSFERANMLNPVELHRDHRKEVGIIGNSHTALNTNRASKGSPRPAGGGAISRDHYGVLILACH